MRKIFFCILLLTQAIIINAQSNKNELLSLVQSFSQTSAVTGREEEASQFVQSLFDAGVIKKDKLGNLMLTIGSGSPRRLFAAPLDEPGYVISSIMENGYLRITPVEPTPTVKIPRIIAKITELPFSLNKSIMKKK